MSQQLIRRALEKRLAAMTPSMSTAWENAQFTPVSGTPYQRVNLMPNTPDNSTQGDKLYFERGIFQVTLCFPIGTGPASAEARSDALRAHFKRGTTLVETPIQVIVIETPKASPSMVDGDRYCVPIAIPYQSQIST